MQYITHLLSYFLANAVSCVSAADVTLQSMTILKSYSLLLPPSDFFVCGAPGTLTAQNAAATQNQTDLSQYNAVNTAYTFTGTESWQVRARVCV